MTEIPISIVTALSRLLPGDSLSAHCGKDGWAKLEVVTVNSHLWTYRCPHALWGEAFRNLPEDFWGSLTFEYDWREMSWMYRVRVCPPIENEFMVMVVSAEEAL